MKNFLKLIALSLCLTVFVGCNDDDDAVVVPSLEVTSSNVAGEWRLAEWRGKPLAEGSYVWMELTRQESFAIYQNIDSFGARCLTGDYNIVVDSSLGAVIRGIYDYTMSTEWSHRYIVTDLTADRMVWTAVDDSEDVSVYVRESIPSEIKDKFPAEE